MTTDAPATDVRADLVSKLAQCRAAIPALEERLAATTKALQADHSKSAPEVVIALSANASEAQRKLDGGRSDVSKVERGIAALDLAAKREKVVGVILPTEESLGEAFMKAKCGWDSFPFPMVLSGIVHIDTLPEELAAIMREHEVQTLNVTLDTEQRLIAIKPTGAGLKAVRLGGGGARTSRSYSHEGRTYTSEELCRQFANVDSVAKVDAAKAQGKSVSFAHLAESTANRIGAVLAS